MSLYLLFFLFMSATCNSYLCFKEKNKRSTFYKRLFLKEYGKKRAEVFIRFPFKVRKKKFVKVKRCRLSERCKKLESGEFHFKCSTESPIVGAKISEVLKGKRTEENGWKNSIRFIHFDFDKIHFKLREDFLYKDRKKLNNFLCLYYLPSVTAQLLKKLLNDFCFQDSHIKETILYHLILKYFYVNYKTYEEKVLEAIGKRHFKFIRSHGRDLKKNIHKKRKQLDSYNNKILDIYCKLKKKKNVIIECVQNRKQQIKKVFTKVKRNIIYFDFFDRLIIFHYLYQNSQYRLILSFFKKFFFKDYNENNLFIINFINKLHEKTIWSSRMRNSRNSDNRSLFSPFNQHNSFSVTPNSIYNEKGKTNDVKRANREMVFLLNEVLEFIDGYMTNEIYLKTEEFSEKIDNSKRREENYNFLFYVYLLNSFLMNRNHYFINQFLYQFVSYYSKKNILFKDDEKSLYFVITIAYSMKQFYLKRKYDVIEEEQKWASRLEPFFHYIKIYNENIFSRNKKYNFSNLNDLNSTVISYMKEFIDFSLSVPNALFPSSVFFRKGPRNTYSLNSCACLLFLQHVCLLETKWNQDFINKQSENHFSNTSGMNLGSKETKKLFPLILDEYSYILQQFCPSVLIYSFFFDELYFFLENYVSDCLYGSEEKKKILIEFLRNRKWEVCLTKVHISFLFVILSALNVLRENKLIERILKANASYLKNIRSEILCNILENCKKGKNRKNVFFLDGLLKEYKHVYSIYKDIITSGNSQRIKRLICYLLNYINEYKKDFLFFKKKLFALNFKQIYFLFIHLNELKLDRELMRTFDAMMEDQKFKKMFNNLLKEKCRDINVTDIEKQDAFCTRNIFVLYYLSCLRVQFFFNFSKTPNLKRAVPFLCFHRDPYYIYFLLIKKYSSIIKDKQKEISENTNMGDVSYDKKSATIPKDVINILLANNISINNSNNNNVNINNSNNNIINVNNSNNNNNKINNSNNNKKITHIINNFFLKEMYSLLSEEEYTLIFYTLMKYLFQKFITIDYRILDKKNEKETTTIKNTPKYKLIYSLLCCTYFCYKKIYELSKLNFLILVKTFLIARDMNAFKILCENNKKLIENNYMLFNSLLNKYLDHSDMKQLGEWKFSEGFLNAPVFIYILNHSNVTVYYLNNFELVNVVDLVRPERKMQIKLYFFIDFRKICFFLTNVDSFFNLHFLKNKRFQDFLQNKGIVLNVENFYNMSEFVIFFGNSIEKKQNIKTYIRRKYKNFIIKKNKIIKDALIISIKS